MVDYYQLLGVFRTASQEDIKNAYKNLAMRWHPDKHPNNRAEAELRFKEVSQAFEVLSDSNKRNVYDRFGIEGLTGGGPFGVQLPGFQFRNPMDVFKDCFGGQDPFSQVFGTNGTTAFAGGQMPGGGMNMSQMHFSQGFGGFPSFGTGGTFTQTQGGIQRSGLGGMQRAGLGGMPGLGQGAFTSFSSSTVGGSGGSGNFQSVSGNFQSVSTSTSTINGKQVMTKRMTGTGGERVEVYEDGKLVSVTVNGVPESIK